MREQKRNVCGERSKSRHHGGEILAVMRFLQQQQQQQPPAVISPLVFAKLFPRDVNWFVGVRTPCPTAPLLRDKRQRCRARAATPRRLYFVTSSTWSWPAPRPRAFPFLLETRLYFSPLRAGKISGRVTAGNKISPDIQGRASLSTFFPRARIGWVVRLFSISALRFPEFSGRNRESRYIPFQTFLRHSHKAHVMRIKIKIALRHILFYMCAMCVPLFFTNIWNI